MTITTTNEKWTTTTVTTAPPGWCAIYKWRDGTYSAFPCVALLTQESSETEWWGGPEVGRRTEPHEREQRVVFAVADYETGEIEAVDRSSRELIAVATESDIAEEWQDLFDEAQFAAIKRKVQGT